MTDEANSMIPPSVSQFARHETLNHKQPKAMGAQRRQHTNTVEGFFSIFKRGMKGVYQHCGEQHLHRYLAEFDFRYNPIGSLPAVG